MDAEMEVDVWKLNLALPSYFQLRMQRGKIDGSYATVIWVWRKFSSKYFSIGKKPRKSAYLERRGILHNPLQPHYIVILDFNLRVK